MYNQNPGGNVPCLQTFQATSCYCVILGLKISSNNTYRIVSKYFSESCRKGSYRNICTAFPLLNTYSHIKMKKVNNYIILGRGLTKMNSNVSVRSAFCVFKHSYRICNDNISFVKPPQIYININASIQ